MTSDDEALLADLRRVVADADPVPAAVLAAADAAIETRELDARLALLIADSTGADSAFETVRGAGDGADDRVLLYEGGDVRIDVAVQQQPVTLTLAGQVEGAVYTEVLLERGDRGVERLDLDDLGRFLVHGLGPGPVRLRCRTPDGDTVLTEWITL